MLKRVSLGLRLCVIHVLLILAFNSLATDFVVEVVDQNGDPISDAVVVNLASIISNNKGTVNKGTVNKGAVEGLVDDVVNSSTEGAENSQSAVMDQVNKSFVPHVLAVEKGRSVSFPNSDNIRHHVYSFSQAKRFEIKLYANRPKAPIVFDTAGVVVLGCNIHDSMIGYIFVSQWSDFVVSDKQGLATLFQQNEMPGKLLVWHPWIKSPEQPLTFAVETLTAGTKEGSYQVMLNITKPKKKASFKKYRK